MLLENPGRLLPHLQRCPSFFPTSFSDDPRESFGADKPAAKHSFQKPCILATVVQKLSAVIVQPSWKWRIPAFF